uniref:Lipoprotein n=1 Tax=Acidobacterium capsulatum TaxID=33075 RepID=A0A7V5CUD4_9BACT
MRCFQWMMVAVVGALLCASPAARAANRAANMQKTALKLQNDLNESLSESNFDALRRMVLRKDAATLVDAANTRAQGHRPKRGPLHKAEKDLEKAFSSGLLNADDAAQLNLDLADFKDAVKNKYHQP